MPKNLSCLIVTSFLYFNFVFCDESCEDLQFSISQGVENEGFHRDVNWLIESLDQNNHSVSCKLSLQLNVPAGVFVNPDQVSELVRKGKLMARVMDDVNVETPAHESVDHTVIVFVPEGFKNKVLIQLPIHLRYQRAVITGGYAKVNLPKPVLLALCPKEMNLCENFPTVKAPCNADKEDIMCYWKNVTYQALFDEVQLFVPIGDLDDYPLVSVVTLLLGCAGSIYILSLLSSAPL